MKIHYRALPPPAGTEPHPNRFLTYCRSWYRFKYTTKEAAAVTCQDCRGRLADVIDRRLVSRIDPGTVSWLHNATPQGILHAVHQLPGVRSCVLLNADTGKLRLQIDGGDDAEIDRLLRQIVPAAMDWNWRRP